MPEENRLEIAVVVGDPDLRCRWAKGCLISYAGIAMAGVKLIAEERQAHFLREGWTAEHDAAHVDGELARAAECYAHHSTRKWISEIVTPSTWPWDSSWWKPAGRIRMLVKAGALIDDAK